MPKSIRNQPEHQYQSAAIPRPLNCFLFYRLDKQKEIVEKCPGANHRDISKIIAKWWKEATDEEKKPYVEKARRAKQEHRKLYPDYKYTPK
ncbi:high mobility group box domain-containing protein, partial [Mycotypha africana]|uniref:high mobility group box domain-containing protein n=1 Tax=Mycotypha africana TaxID=64632 RepID=UPI0022FFCA41